MKVGMMVGMVCAVMIACGLWVNLRESEDRLAAAEDRLAAAEADAATAAARYECNRRIGVALEIVGIGADMSPQTARFIKMGSYSLSAEDMVRGAVEVEPLIKRYSPSISESVIAGGKPGGKRLDIKYPGIDIGAIIRDIRSGEC